MSSRTLRRVLSIVILIALLIPPLPVGAAEPTASPPQPATARRFAMGGTLDHERTKGREDAEHEVYKAVASWSSR